MIVDREQLEATKMPELKQLIVQMKGDPSQPGETKSSLIERILFESAKEPQPEKDSISDGIRGPAQVVTCSVEDVKKAVANFTFRGMKFFHNPEDNTWLFRVQIKSSSIRDTNSGTIQVIERWRDDSGTMNQPLSTIKRCASILMQNAPRAESAAPQHNPAAQYTEVA